MASRFRAVSGMRLVSVGVLLLDVFKHLIAGFDGSMRGRPRRIQPGSSAIAPCQDQQLVWVQSSFPAGEHAAIQGRSQRVIFGRGRQLFLLQPSRIPAAALPRPFPAAG